MSLFLSSLVLSFLYILQFCEVYILHEQLRLESVLVTIPQFFDGGQIKRISFNQTNCVGLNSVVCNGIWSCTQRICYQSFNADTRYIVTYPLDHMCNSSYGSFESRIKSEDALWYYNFVDIGSMIEFNISWLLYVLTFICLLCMRYNKQPQKSEFKIVFFFMLLLYCANTIMIAIMFGFQQKFLSEQEFFTQDFRPDVINTSSKNINNIFIALLSFQFIAGIIQHYLIYLNIDTQSETPLIQ